MNLALSWNSNNYRGVAREIFLDYKNRDMSTNDTLNASKNKLMVIYK